MNFCKKHTKNKKWKTDKQFLFNKEKRRENKKKKKKKKKERGREGERERGREGEREKKKNKNYGRFCFYHTFSIITILFYLILYSVYSALH